VLFDEPELRNILGLWRNLTEDEEEVAERVQETVAQNDEALVKLLESAKGVTRSQGMGNYSFTEQPRLDPKTIEPYLNPDDIVGRVRGLLDENDLSENQRTALKQFIEEYELRQQGEDPNVYYRRLG